MAAMAAIPVFNWSFLLVNSVFFSVKLLMVLFAAFVSFLLSFPDASLSLASCIVLLLFAIVVLFEAIFLFAVFTILSATALSQLLRIESPNGSLNLIGLLLIEEYKLCA